MYSLKKVTQSVNSKHIILLLSALKVYSMHLKMIMVTFFEILVHYCSSIFFVLLGFKNIF